MHRLNVSIFFDQRSRRLLTDARNTRNIIRSIAHERLDIDKFLRCHQITRLHIGSKIIFNFGSCLLGLWNSNLDMVRCQLQQITITGYNRDIHPFPFAHSGNRS